MFATATDVCGTTYICIAHGTTYICIAHGTTYICIAHGTTYMCIADGTTYISIAHGTTYISIASHSTYSDLSMGWIRLVGSLKLYFSFAKEPCKRDHILQKRPVILRSLLMVATSY